MDEKKVREAISYNLGLIEHLKDEVELLKKKEDSSKILIVTYQGQIDICKTIAEALEKQLPKKVEMRTEYRDLNDELVCFKGFCPSCGWTVDSSKNKSCNRCTQLLDWSEDRKGKE